MFKFLRYEACPNCRETGKDRRGDNLAVYSDGGAHCFSCSLHRFGNSGFVPRLPVIEEKHAALLPSDFSSEIPGKAWEWLLQYGLSWKYWQPFVGWSENHSRLMFTTDGSFSIGRLIGEGGDSPSTKRKWRTWGNCHETPQLFKPLKNEFEQIVLVEDLISAHKIGQVCQAIPLFGTKVFNSLLPCLRHLKTPILMWLDKDQDLHARTRAAHLSLLTGIPVRFVSTTNDPKALPLQTIKEIIS